MTQVPYLEEIISSVPNRTYRRFRKPKDEVIFVDLDKAIAARPYKGNTISSANDCHEYEKTEELIDIYYPGGVVITTLYTGSIRGFWFTNNKSINLDQYHDATRSLGNNYRQLPHNTNDSDQSGLI